LEEPITYPAGGRLLNTPAPLDCVGRHENTGIGMVELGHMVLDIADTFGIFTKMARNPKVTIAMMDATLICSLLIR
jgi:hypothetical protein